MTLRDTINKAEQELYHRERANAHLRGIPKIQNETAIAKLYDTLNELHIDALETYNRS